MARPCPFYGLPRPGPISLNPAWPARIPSHGWYRRWYRNPVPRDLYGIAGRVKPGLVFGGCPPFSARSAERKSAVRIRSPTTMRGRFKESRGMAPVRIFSRSGSSDPRWLARSLESGCGSPRKAYERGARPGAVGSVHKECVRRRAGIRLASTTDSGSVSPDSNLGPAAPQKPHFTGVFSSPLST
jgi:hypothetical protein